MKNSKLQEDMYDSGMGPDEVEKRNKYRESGEDRINKLNALIRGFNGKSILNIGCASGDYLDADFRRNNTLLGVDISMNNLKAACKYNHIPICADIEEGLPFKNGSIDIVIALEIIEHIVDTDFMLYEINRVLKKEGLLLITTPNVNAPLSYIMMLFFDMPPFHSSRYKSQHVRDFTRKTLNMALRNNGFEVNKFQGNALFVPYLGYYFQRLCAMMPRLGDAFIIEAVKKVNMEEPDTRMKWYLDY